VTVGHAIAARDAPSWNAGPVAQFDPAGEIVVID